MEINSYDIYLEFEYHGYSERFRIQKKLFKELNEKKLSDVKGIIPYFTIFGNLTIINAYRKEGFRIEADEERIKIIPQRDHDINYGFCISYRKKSDRVYFSQLTDKDKPTDEFELKWKYSIDDNIPYTLYLDVNNRMRKLTDDFITGFEEKAINFKNKQIRIFKDKDDSISIIMK